jgi:hypothetical protein
MTISKHATTFAGLPVQEYDPDAREKGHPFYTYRIGGLEYGEEKYPFPERLDRFLTEHGGPKLTALVIGAWHYEGMMAGAAEVIEALIAGRERMPNLRALFLGDIVYEECEISWIQYGDVAPLLPAFPQLEEFRIRGASNLTFGKLRHERLRSFAIESGGLPERLLAEVWAAELPNLEHLELWLGTENYGGIATPAPLAPLLSGALFPRLKSLGLRNCDIANEVAQAIAGSPLLERLEVLDLSLGNLSAEGATVLLGSPVLSSLKEAPPLLPFGEEDQPGSPVEFRLKKLDLHHHYIEPAVVRRLQALPLEVDVSDAKEAEDDGHRYITASE